MARDGCRWIGCGAAVAVAVYEHSRCEVLGVATGSSDAETFWFEFLLCLASCGLKDLKLMIARVVA